MDRAVPWPALLVFVLPALAAAAIAAWLLLRGSRRPFARAVAFALLLLAVGQVGAVLPASSALGHAMGLVADFLQPAALFWVAAVMLGAPDSASRRQAQRRAILVTATCAGAFWLANTDLAQTYVATEDSLLLVRLGPLGRPLYGLLVVLLAFGIAQLETLLRAMRDPQRYGMKFLLLGLSIPAAYQVLLASQLLLLGAAPAGRGLPSAITGAAAVALVALAFWRSRAAEPGAVYVAPQIVYGSVTFLVIGLYLLAVGAAGELVRQSWPLLGADIAAVLVLLALAGVVAAALSRTARGELRRFVGKSLYRSKYDYRAKWLEVTESFEGAESVDQILERLLELLARTFDSGRLSIFIRVDADASFHQVRSVNTEAAPPLPESALLLARLRLADAPIDLDAAPPALEAWREATQAVLLAPLRSRGELLGFVALGPARRNEPHGTDDRNLLRAVTHHASVLLSHARLAQERHDSAEMEALHRVSAFCVHDLKNLAASLALVAKNAETHGRDPEFQESALHTVARTSDKIMGLVRRLSRRAEARAEATEPVRLRGVIEEALSSLNGALETRVAYVPAEVPAIRANRDELHQLLLNLLLNASEAVAAREAPLPSGEPGIHIRTEASEGRVRLVVADRGPGIPPGELQHLFQPFRSTKDGGLGIGLYECRRIVEANGGRIRVEEQEGGGSVFALDWPECRETGAASAPATPKP
jgi:putative PEP-CTERM system histidine kinase